MQDTKSDLCGAVTDESAAGKICTSVYFPNHKRESYSEVCSIFLRQSKLSGRDMCVISKRTSIFPAFFASKQNNLSCLHSFSDPVLC
jgi:hypothetical protein